MSRTEQAKKLITEHRELLLGEFVDLITAASEIAQELGIMSVYTTPLDGKSTVRFYGDKFPFDDEDIEKRPVKIFEDNDHVEWSVTDGNIKYMCYGPKED